MLHRANRHAERAAATPEQTVREVHRHLVWALSTATGVLAANVVAVVALSNAG